METRLTLCMTALLLAAGLATTTSATADDGSVMISSPAEDALLDAMEAHELVYEVVPGPRGDHVHVYVDDAEVGILRQLAGSYTLSALTPGEREICIRVVNRAHVPTGTEACIKVRVD